MLTILILSSVVALIAAILAMIYIVPAKKKENLSNRGKLLHELLNFNHLFLEKIFHVLYVLSMCFTVIFGFFMLFYVEEVYHYGSWYSSGYYTSEWCGYYGLLILLFGPIAVRIFYEFSIMLVLAVKNIIEINSKLKNQNTPTAPIKTQSETKVEMSQSMVE